MESICSATRQAKKSVGAYSHTLQKISEVYAKRGKNEGMLDL